MDSYKVCDACGTPHLIFNGEQASGLATFRSFDGLLFVSHYGSTFDGNVMIIIGSVPEDTKAICDACVQTMLDEGTMKTTSNYINDGTWAGQNHDVPEGDWEEIV